MEQEVELMMKTQLAPVAQRIEHRFPKPCAQVRVLPGAPRNALPEMEGSVAMTRYWVAIDLVIVLLFVIIGRHNHHHGDSLSGIVSTTWPFAVGLAIGWLIVLLRHQDGVSLSAGSEVFLSTVAFGMILRVIAGQGTAFAFIVVALVFLGALMLGLRFVCVKYFHLVT